MNEVNKFDDSKSRPTNRPEEDDKTRNGRLYRTAELLLAASTEILPMNREMSTSFFELGNMLLDQIKIETKVPENELDDMISELGLE